MLDRLLQWLIDLTAEVPMTVTEVEQAAQEQHRCELREAITNMAATAARMPAHWTDRKAAIHKQIDALLYELEALTNK